MHATRHDAHATDTAPNAQRLLWAGFMAILAAGVGFAIRGGILDNWREEFGFTALQVGQITGAGLTGFCFGIIIGGLIVDKLGYGKLVALALVGHILSALVTFSAASQANAYQMLFWGSFIFAFANGTLEAVANPLVATVFPNNRTHYLNILHASWPAGMVLGTVAGWVLDDRLHIDWRWQLALYLVPTALYALMFLGQKFPKSEAAAKGASFIDMFRDVGILGSAVACYLLALFFGGIFKELGLANAATIGYALGGALLLAVAFMTKFSIGSLLLFVLFVTHALVGAVELGTDSWIQNITGNLFTSEQGKALFIWTSVIMFGLRFCAHFIETRLGLSPIGLLLASSILAFVGLRFASGMNTFPAALAALGIYAVGKTFFWPTMLAVVGDRFPQTGAVAMSIMGGIGMLSAGLIGGPGLGYCKDRFAGEALQRADAAVYERYKSETPSRFLDIPSTEVFGLDGPKVAEARAAAAAASPEQKAAVTADQQGDRETLKVDAFIPAAMAAVYLALLVYFKATGGYRRVEMKS
ncbi:MAG: MFS transporter [Planctomycetia bacterium]